MVGCQQGTFQDSRDGNIYKTIKVGKRVWFAENLRFRESIASPIPGGDLSNVKEYGYLYYADGANEFIPEGWRLPTMDDWWELNSIMKPDELFDERGFGLKYAGGCAVYEDRDSESEGGCGLYDFDLFGREYPTERYYPDFGLETRFLSATKKFHILSCYACYDVEFGFSESWSLFGGKCSSVRLVKDD